MKFIIENFTNAEDYQGLISEVQAQGHECFVIGKNAYSDFDPAWVKVGDMLLVQGSIQMVKHLQNLIDPRTVYPVAYASFPKFLCSAYYPHLNRYLFNDRHEFVRLKDLKENRFEYYAKFGKEAFIFVRPDSGDKTFTGQLLDLQDFDRFWNNGLSSAAQDDDLVVVSTPKNVRGEWRFVCSDKPEVIAHSTYIYQGQKIWIPTVPEKAKKLVEKVLEIGYYPDPVFCVDICEDNDGNYWVMELTSFSSAGLYACDKKAIVEKVSERAKIGYRKEFNCYED